MVRLERGGRRRSDLRLRVAVLSAVVVGCVMNASSALATPVLTQVPGSPFASGAATDAVAFSPSGKLLASADVLWPCYADSTLSVFSVGPGGGLTRVPGSPFATPQRPGSVAFSPSGKLLADRQRYDQRGGVVLGRAGGRLTPATSARHSRPGGEYGPGPDIGAFSPSGALLATATRATASRCSPSGQAAG